MDAETSEQIVDWVRTRFFGKYRGVVTKNVDPTGRGRLKVKVPAVLADQEVWAMPCVPYAGEGVGFYATVPNKTGCWVEFEGGLVSYPIAVGFFWADDQLPDQSKPEIKIWKTDSLTLRLDDKQEEVRIESAGGAKLTITAELKSLAGSGGGEHVVSSSGVVSKKGSVKSEVSSTSFKVNDGALEVT